MAKTSPLTAEQCKRVNTEIESTQKKLDKELSYSVDLQHKVRISELEKHISHLKKMLIKGWNAPVFSNA